MAEKVKWLYSYGSADVGISGDYIVCFDFAGNWWGIRYEHATVKRWGVTCIETVQIAVREARKMAEINASLQGLRSRAGIIRPPWLVTASAPYLGPVERLRRYWVRRLNLGRP